MVNGKFVKVDIDGVLRDMVGKCCEIYNKKYGYKYDEVTIDDITDYNIAHFFEAVKLEEGVSPSYYFYTVNGQEVFLKSDMLFEAKHAIDKLIENGFRVVIVSYQFNNLNKMSTLQWLSNNEIQYHDICFTDKKWLVMADYMIDDNPQHLFDEKETAKKILVMQPYNNVDVGDCFVAEDIHEAVEHIISSETDTLYF